MFGLAGTAGSDISQYGLRLCHDAWQRLAGITGQANLNSYEDEHRPRPWGCFFNYRALTKTIFSLPTKLE